MHELLPTLILVAGVGQLCVLLASALVPWRLQWKRSLQGLPRLHRQLYWIYGAYVVLSILTFGLISLFYSGDLASGSGLARAVCGYLALFWGIRLALQALLDVQEHLTAWWLKLGYRLLTVLFAFFTFVYGAAALLPKPPVSLLPQPVSLFRCAGLSIMSPTVLLWPGLSPRSPGLQTETSGARRPPGLRRFSPATRHCLLSFRSAPIGMPCKSSVLQRSAQPVINRPAVAGKSTSVRHPAAVVTGARSTFQSCGILSILE